MTNPYHDETGRFCSKGEMGAAVQRLVSAGDTNTALNLLSELKGIEEEQDKVDLKNAPLVSRRVKFGYNEGESKQLLNELFEKHEGSNLAQALVYEGFATPAKAYKIAEDRAVKAEAKKLPEVVSVVREPSKGAGGRGSWRKAGAVDPEGESPAERETRLAAEWDERFGVDDSVKEVVWNGTGVGRTRKFFADDDVMDLRDKARSSSDEAEIRELARSKDKILVIGLATNTNAPADLLTRLANHKDWGVRRAVAKNPSTPKNIREYLRNDPQKWVRDSVI